MRVSDRTCGKVLCRLGRALHRARVLRSSDSEALLLGRPHAPGQPPHLQLEGSQQLPPPLLAPLLDPGPLDLDALQLLSDPGGRGSGRSARGGGSTLPEARHSPGCAPLPPHSPHPLPASRQQAVQAEEGRVAGAARTGPGSLVRSLVLAQGQRLATCPQSLCSMAKDAQLPLKLLVPLQQALGLPSIVLRVQRPGVTLGTMGPVPSCPLPTPRATSPPAPRPGFKGPPSDGEAALQPGIPGSLPQARPAAGRPRGWHR